MNEGTKLKNIVYTLEQKFIIDDGTWLDHLNPSQAFLTCIGAGPWKIKRRTSIQKAAVLALGLRDLSEIKDVSIFNYPLNWQNQKVKDLIKYLNYFSYNMNDFATVLKNSLNPLDLLYSSTNTKGRAKVLDLFARDYLKISSFPIDRHVKRILKENGFPINEKYMINLCKEADLNASYVARVFVSGSGKFTGNGKI